MWRGYLLVVVVVMLLLLLLLLLMLVLVLMLVLMLVLVGMSNCCIHGWRKVMFKPPKSRAGL
jgi:hypothetical protein